MSEFPANARNTKLIDEVLGQINDVCEGLNALNHNKYTRVPEKLPARESANHVERALQRAEKPATPTTKP